MTFNNRMGLAVVASAMALGCGASQAATVVPAAVEAYSWQYLQGAVASDPAVPLAAIAVTLGADYTVDDEITLTFAGASGTFISAAVPPTATCTGPAPNAPYPIVAFLNGLTPNVYTFRVTQVTTATTIGDVCTFTGFSASPSALAATGEPLQSPIPYGAAGYTGTNITVSYAAFVPLLGNQPIDVTGVNTGTVATIFNQFAFADTGFTGTVDVNPYNNILTNGRTRWVAGTTACAGHPVGSDCTTLTTYNVEQVAVGNFATLNTSSIVLNGNFSFDCTAAQQAHPNITIAPVAGLAVAANCTSVTVTPAAATPVAGLAPGAPDVFLVTAVSDGTSILPAPQTFGATTTFNWVSGYHNFSSSDTYTLGDGAWALNGFNAFVSYMPYGPNISQIVYLTNKSNQTGSVNITAYNTEGAACNSAAPIATVAPGAILKLAGPLATLFDGCYGAGFTDKVSFNVIANIPAGLGELYSAYNNNGALNAVVNNSNGKVATGTIAAGAGALSTTNGSQL